MSLLWLFLSLAFNPYRCQETTTTMFGYCFKQERRRHIQTGGFLPQAAKQCRQERIDREAREAAQYQQLSTEEKLQVDKTAWEVQVGRRARLLIENMRSLQDNLEIEQLHEEANIFPVDMISHIARFLATVDQSCDTRQVFNLMNQNKWDYEQAVKRYTASHPKPLKHRSSRNKKPTVSPTSSRTSLDKNQEI